MLGHNSTIYEIALRKNIMISVGRDRQIGYFKFENGVFNSVSFIEGHDKQIFSVSINIKGSLVVTGGRDKKIKFWEI